MRRGARFAFLCALACLGGAAPPVAPVQDSAPTESAPSRAERIASWREALELDLARDVLADEDAYPGGAEALARDGEALALLARAYADAGRHAEARRRVEAALVAGAEGRAHLELALARLDLAADRLDAVESRLADGSGAPRAELDALPAARFVLGQARVRAGRAADARAPLEAFVEDAPRHVHAPAAWHMLAQEALARRDLERARACRERAAELGRWHAFYRTRRLQRRANPDAPEPRIGLAQLWIAAEDWDRARDVLAPVFERHPDACAAWRTQGELERGSGDPDAARAAYGRAVECDETDALARFNLALLQLDAGLTDDARAHLERVVASPAADEPPLIAAHLVLARVLAEAGETDASGRRYARYRALGGTEPLEAR